MDKLALVEPVAQTPLNAAAAEIRPFFPPAPANLALRYHQGMAFG
jgi:hypothetical protein